MIEDLLDRGNRVAVSTVLSDSDRAPLGRRIDRWSRWAFPVAFVLLTVVAFGMK